MNLAKVDPEIARLIEAEEKRQTEVLEMIPSENYTSRAVMEALATVLTNKYSEGYPKKRYYQGNAIVDEVEILAQERAKKLFGVPHVIVQPYSGSPANTAVYFALLEPLKDKVEISKNASHENIVSEFKKLGIEMNETKAKEKAPKRAQA